MKLLYILGFLLIGIVNSSQDVPIPIKGYGFSVGDPYGTLHIEFFLDFQCPDSKASYLAWANVKKSISLLQNKVKLTYQHCPLPYHFYASIIHQTFFYILKKLGDSAAQSYMTYVFNNQDDFTEEKFLTVTGKDFREQFAKRISSVFGSIDAGDLANQLVIGTDSFKSLKDHWRYTTIVNGVSGTPMFKVNGVMIDGAEEFSYLDWINFIRDYKS